MKIRSRLLPVLFSCSFLVSAANLVSAQQSPLWLRYPAISPDGEQIAFSYGGQIWRVSSDGGEAVPLTSSFFYSTHPVWSPDSSQIAFSSTRYGNPDVFIIPSAGGEIRRLTYHSSPDTVAAFSPDGRQVYFDSIRLGDPKENFGGYHRPSCSQLFAVPATGGREKLIVSVPCKEARPDKSGRFILYTDVPSGENEWRKHEVSAASHNVWVYDAETSTHRQITFEPQHDRNPAWSDTDGVFYYLSEKEGSQNVFRRSFKGKDAPVQITKHDTHPVRFLTCSKGGDLVYGYDGEIWKLTKSETEPKKVDVRISQGSMLDGSFYTNVTKDISELSISKDGSQLAIVARGEVFVVNPATGQTRRITTTPEHERNISFSPDGRRLLYISHRDGNWDAFETSITDPEVKSFLTPGPLEETKLISTDSDILSPAYSPDGKSIAFQEDYSRIKVFNQETKATTTAVKDGHLFSYTVDDLGFSWSPDGKMLAVTTGSAAGRMEIQLADPTGQKDLINITQSGFLEASPEFTSDGKAVFYLSSRAGLKAADSKDAEYDVFVTYLTQEAFDNRNEPAAPPAAKEGEAPPPTEEWTVETEGLEQRTLRVSPMSSAVPVYKLMPDGKSVFWPHLSPVSGITAFRTGPGGAGLAPLFNYTKNPGAIVIAPDGQSIFIAHSGGIDKVTLATKAVTPLPVSAEIAYDPRGEMAYLFDYFWRTTKIKFYRKDMHGVDWDLYKKEYAKYLPYISTWEDFAEMLSELSGELNASHMGAYYRNPPEYGDNTGSLGLYYDHNFDGPGMKIVEYLKTGPAGKASSKLRPGAIILAVDGSPVGKEMDIYPLLNHKVGTPVQLAIQTAEGENATETVAPISLGECITVHAYHRWVERCKKSTEELSGGRLGFIHISGMMTPQYKDFYRQLFSDDYADKEGMIIDVRFNSGGNLSEQLIADLSAKFAGIQVDRNDNYLGDMPSTRWWKPTILLANTFSYSDGSIFPHLYKSAGLGKFVGTPVPGTGTSVWQIKLFNDKFIYTLPELGRKAPEGNYFERSQDEPDITVYNTPDDIEDGRDPQLEEAVKTLLKQIDSMSLPHAVPIFAR